MASAVSINSFIFWDLPHGKPNGRIAGKKECVIQPPQKGRTCWTYALHILRERIGKHPEPGQEAARKIEQAVSNRRKSFNTIHDKERRELDIAKQLLTDPNYTKYRLWDQKKASDFLPKLQAIQENPETSAEQKEEAVKLYECLNAFSKQLQDLEPFIQDKYRIQCIKVNGILCKTLGINPKNIYDTDKPLYKPADVSFELLGPSKKLSYLDNCTFRGVYRSFGFKESNWAPSQSIETFIEELTDKGPLSAKGFFGKSFYQEAPFCLETPVAGYPIFGWKPTAILKKFSISHSVIILGALKTSDNKSRVFFIDPLDGSDPKNHAVRRIYTMSYKTFTERIINLHGLKNLDGENYVLYHPSKKIECKSLSM